MLGREIIRRLEHSEIAWTGLDDIHRYDLCPADRELVRQLVEQLPEKYRLPIQLYYSADLTVASIAQVLKLPENTVKSRLRRAKQKIRISLEEMEYEGSTI